MILVHESWVKSNDTERREHILRLMNATEVSDHDKRMEAIRAVLYLCQGRPHSIFLDVLYFIQK